MNILFYILFSLFSSNSQNTVDCNSIVKIDNSSYNLNKVKYDDFRNQSKLKKVNTQIKINNTSIVFNDDLSEENFIEYSIIGEDKKGKWLLISGQDYNQIYYYLINKEKGTKYKLIGEPKIYDKKIVCIEGSYTDGSAIIEIWNLKSNEISLQKSFSLKKCLIFNIQDSYLNENQLYIKNSYEISKCDYYKLKIN